MDAWDPTDAATPQRTMAAPWADGAPAKVAVRAIGRPFFDDPANRQWQLAYLDVAGPGILVDPADSSGNAPRPTIALGDSFDVRIEVMNTGEATDTFDFSALLPNGWTATTQRMTLTAGQRATATVKVTVPENAGVHHHRMFVRGQSVTDSAVRTDYDFLVDVVKRSTTVNYTGDFSVDYSDPATLSAIVRDGSSSAPLSGKSVTFTVAGQTLTATTGSDGVASVQWVADAIPGLWDVKVSVAEDALRAGTSTRAPFDVDREDLTISVTNALVQSATGSPQLVLRAVDEADGYPADRTKAGAAIELTPTLTATAQNHSATFDADGNAVVPLTGTVDVWSMKIDVTGFHFTGPTVTGELVLFNPGGEVYGSERGPDSAGAAVKLSTSMVYQGATLLGSVKVDTGARRFSSDRPQWLVVVGQTAIFQATGTINGLPAAIRGKIVDNGNGAGTHDRFSVDINGATAPARYVSGEVVAQTGNLFVRLSTPR